MNQIDKKVYLALVQPASTFQKAFFFAGIIGAAIFLSYLVDDNMGLGWPTNVINNWRDFGLASLHGQLVYNPGGFEVAEHPQVYGGMSPVCLYPVYLALKILGWTGLGVLSFHVFFLPFLLWGIWRLLGRDSFSVLLAAVALLCPGYMRSLRMLDMNTLAVLPAIPYAVIVLGILKKPKLTLPLAAFLVVFTLAFMSLNWTSAWVCGPLIFLFLGLPGVNRRSLIFLAAVMFIGVPMVVALSFAAKFGSHATETGSTGIGHIIAGYTWGGGGYGEGTSTGRDFLRLAFVNGVGLFPLGLVFIYAVFDRIRKGERLSWLPFAPLAVAIADIIIMRNYFGHHPPMAGPLLLVGLVFSIVLLRVPLPEKAGDGKIPFKIVPAAALLGFGYGLLVLMFFRANQAEMFSLAHLVQQHTAREDVIVVLKEKDPETAAMAERLQEVLDRHFVVVDDVKGLDDEKGHAAILSSVKLDVPYALKAQSTASSQSWLSQAGAWFNRSISRRSPGDRLGLSANYFLYSPAQ